MSPDYFWRLPMSHPCRPETHRLSERIEAAAIVRVDTVVFDLVDDLLADDWRGVIGGSTSNLVAGSDGAVFASLGESHASSSLKLTCPPWEGV